MPKRVESVNFRSMEIAGLTYPRFASLLFTTLILVAHLFAQEGYRTLFHTISDLGSQGYRWGMVMRFGFLAFGLSVVAGVFADGFEWRTFPLGLYGASVAMTGIFCAKPFLDRGQSFSAVEDRLHSFFATLAGIAFCIGMAMQVLYSGSIGEGALHLLFLAAVTAISIAFGLNRNFRGLIQRGLYLVSLLWFGWFFSP